MREILFRGKHIHAHSKNEHLDGTWVYGYLCDENYINTVDEDEYGGKFTSEVLIDPETVCQYTGLIDKNGRKIFENDKCCVGRPCVLAYGIIKYLDGCFCFVEDGTENILRLCDVRINGYEIKVDGNIFDNPDLSERKTEWKKHFAGRFSRIE